jgi:flagellum-specific peptidoglycan hydrolase FlgJ
MGATPEVIAAAQACAKKWKVPASVTIAQYGLESGWGEHEPPGSNNPFGMKAGAWALPGTFVECDTTEVVHGTSVSVTARFRKFDSIADAFDAHGKLLATAAPYAQAMRKVPNADDFADALTGVYATDPAYGAKLRALMRADNLYQYDVAATP